MADVVSVREVDHENGAQHDDDDADGSNTEQRAEQYRDASGELG